MGETLNLTVDTGNITICLEDTNGNEIGSFMFCPTDMNIINRWPESVKMLEKLTISEEPTIEEIESITDAIKKSFDYLLATNASESVFGKLSPLTPVSNGDFFYEVVLEQVGKVIEKVLDKRVEQKRAKISKYTKKYNG